FDPLEWRNRGGRHSHRGPRSFSEFGAFCHFKFFTRHRDVSHGLFVSDGARLEFVGHWSHKLSQGWYQSADGHYRDRLATLPVYDELAAHSTGRGSFP